MKHLILFLLLTGFFSCKRENVYQAPSFAERKEVDVRVLNNQYMFRYGHHPLVFDSLLIVGDMNQEANICLFNRYTGNLVAAFGSTGNGPGELVTPMEYTVDRAAGYLYVNDYGKKSVIRYDLKNRDEEGNPPYQEIRLAGALGERSHVWHVKDSLFVAQDLFNRLLLGTPGKTVQELKTPTPDSEVFASESDWYAFTNAYTCNAIAPSGKHFASATLFGGILEIFDIEGGKVQSPRYCYFYKPVFKKEGIVYQPTDETVYGFCHLCVTDNYLYATVHGKKKPTAMPTSIWQFDWNGRPVREYRCGNTQIENFTVDEESGSIYVIAYNSEGELFLGEVK